MYLLHQVFDVKVIYRKANFIYRKANFFDAFGEKNV